MYTNKTVINIDTIHNNIVKSDLIGIKEMFMTCHWVCNNINSTGTTNGEGTSYSSPLVVSGVRVTRCLVLCVCFVDRSLSLCPFSFGHCVVVLLRFTDSDYPFDIFKLFLYRLGTVHTIDNTILKIILCFPVLIRFMDYEYPFGIFKLFLMSCYFCLVLTISLGYQ